MTLDRFVVLPPWRLSMLWSRREEGDPGRAWLREVLADLGGRA